MNKNISILIVEDDEVPKKIIKQNLLRSGFHIETAVDGKDALGKLNEKFCQIVITDWLMPEMDGLKLCKEIRKRKYSGYVYIIIITLKESKESIIKGLNAGADDYIVKPIDIEELQARIKTGIRILNLEKSLLKAVNKNKVLSITDSLTGCYNRLYLTKQLNKEIVRSRRYKHHLSILLCDIDHFKKINDDFGHLAGDKVLKDFVADINKLIRNNIDWVARYGGEEFLIILPETNLNGAIKVAERMKQSVNEERIIVNKKNIKITFSMGITNFDPENSDDIKSVDDIIKKVDELLYKAKNEGRNCIKYE